MFLHKPEYRTLHGGGYGRLNPLPGQRDSYGYLYPGLFFTFDRADNLQDMLTFQGRDKVRIKPEYKGMIKFADSLSSLNELALSMVTAQST